MKRVIICGSRGYNDYEIAEEFISECLVAEGLSSEIIIVSGGCRGADLLGERFAEKYGYFVEKYKADWKRYGRAAGPIRNREMAKNANVVICFWDGKSKGTKTMIEYAKKENKTVYIKFIE